MPTGNFGNVFAGYGAQRMGSRSRQFVVGSNRNDILTRFFTTGTMTIGEVHPTLSPSMDIQVSTNLERLLFELYGRDGDAVAELMARFRAEGTVTVDTDRLELLARALVRGRVDDDEHLGHHRRTSTSAPGCSSIRTPRSAWPRRRGPAADARVPMVCSPPRTRPSSPTRSSRHRHPPAAAPPARRPVRARGRFATVANDVEVVRGRIEPPSTHPAERAPPSWARFGP